MVSIRRFVVPAANQAEAEAVQAAWKRAGLPPERLHVSRQSPADSAESWRREISDLQTDRARLRARAEAAERDRDRAVRELSALREVLESAADDLRDAAAQVREGEQ